MIPPPKLNKSKVLTRVQVLFSLAVILPITVAAFFSYFQIKNSLSEQAHQRLHLASKYHANVLIKQLITIESLLTSLEPFSEIDQDHLTSRQNDLKARTVVIATTDSLGVPQTMFGREKTLGEIGYLTTDTQLTNNRKSTITQFANGGELLLTVETAHNQRLTALLNKANLFGETKDHLLNNDFCVFDASIPLFCTPSLKSELANLQSLGDGSGYSGKLSWRSGGQQYFATARDLFVHSYFNGSLWTVVSAEDAETVFAPIRVFRWLFPAVVALSVLCLLLLVFSQTRRQLTPLSILTRGAATLGEGKFETRIALDAEDEFGELAATFNGMADKLGAKFKFLIAMSEIDALLLSSTDIVEIMGLIAKRMPELVPTDVAAIFVTDPDDSKRGKMYHSGPNETGVPVVLSRNLEDILPNTGLGREQYSVDKPEYIPEFATGLVKLEEELNLLPLYFEERLLGCLCLANHGAQTLPSSILDQASSVADRLTVALSAIEKQRRLYEQAHYDSLTGLANRSLFLDRLEQYIVQASRKSAQVALVYLDLNQFKQINDTLGHSQGDEVLRQAAQRFRGAIRESDTVARLSGDEFAFALPDLSEAHGAVKVAETLIHDLKTSFQVMDQNFTLGASIGIALYPDDGISAEQLLQNADVAMYRAKAEQGSRYRFFEESMNQELIERSSIGQRLHDSVENNQLHLVYQPKVKAACATIHSVEALLRWHDDELGWVSPEKFISIAEDTGIIDKIGEFVLDSACNQFAQWRAQGLAISQIAVNVSPRQILYTDIVKTVADTLDRHDLPGECLELEITESLLISDYELTRRILEELQQLGVRLALDDFGTGYSSLSYLHQLPFDTLKIDKSFVDNLGTSANADAIVESIIALAKSLNKTIVAEGIESEEQNQFLVSRGCQLLQGYLYSKPLAAEKMTSVLKERRPLSIPVPS